MDSRDRLIDDDRLCIGGGRRHLRWRRVGDELGIRRHRVFEWGRGRRRIGELGVQLKQHRVFEWGRGRRRISELGVQREQRDRRGGGELRVQCEQRRIELGQQRLR
jgi:hypothetical protein